jgi:SAF domain
MSSILDRSNGSSRVAGARRRKTELQGRGPNPSSERLPKPNKVRRPVMALASTVLVFASIAIFAGLYANAGHRVPVVAVVQPVNQGQQISSSDLGQVEASISGSVHPIPYSAVGSVVGKQAAVALVPGSILTAGDVSSASRLPAGDAIVGIALKPGQLPSAGVVPGEQVMVIQTGLPGSPAPAFSSSTQSNTVGVLVPRADVYDVAPPSAASGQSTQLVSVEVAEQLAPAVSVAAAAGQVSIVVIAPGSSGS